jgi:hypothetical protein
MTVEVTMWAKKLLKIEIAEWQLLKAIRLFSFDEDFISSITLAGAAEEILGRLLEQSGQTSALSQKVDELCRMHYEVFGLPAAPKDYYELQNRARNEMKHLVEKEAVWIDVEEAAVRLIDRAIQNYKTLTRRSLPAFDEFEQKAASWYGARSAALKNAANPRPPE